MVQWSAGHDLRLINDGLSPTYVRPQGESIIDLTWVSSQLVGRAGNWSVHSDLLSLSDHLYVLFAIDPVRGEVHIRGSSRLLPYPRWDNSRMNDDLFTQSINWACAVGPAAEETADTDGMCSWLTRVMTEACDASAPRVGSRPPRKYAFWWNENIAELRRKAIRARRRWMRSKRRGRPDVVAGYQTAYRLAKRLLGAEIISAKSAAWRQLVESVDGDPWGLPYRLVLNKLRGSTSSLLETLEVPLLRQLLRKLFPHGDELPIINWERRWGWAWSEEWSVSEAEVRAALEGKKRKTNSAPGPDGIGLRLWRRINGETSCGSFFEMLKGRGIS